MATYDFSVGDFGGSRTKTVTHRGGTVGDLTGMVVNSCKVTNPSGVVEDWTSGFTGGPASTVAFAPPSSTYFDEVGTWTLLIRYTLGSVTETLDPIALSVGPSGGTAPGSVAGATTATGLNAQIATLAALATADNPLEILLPEGTLTLDDNIDLASHVRLRGTRPGVVRCVASFSGAADTPTNAIFRANETVGSVATTITVEAERGAIQVTLADTTGLAVGDWIRLSGNDTVLGDAETGQVLGTSIVTYEIVEVFALPGAGVVQLGSATTTRRTPLRLHHAIGTTVVDVTPVVGCGVHDLVLDGGAGPVACGVHLRGAVGASVSGIVGENLTRAVVCADRGTLDTQIEDILIRGACNAGVLLDSAHGTNTRNLRNDPRGEGHNSTAGVPRALYHERYECTGSTFSDIVADNLDMYGVMVWDSCSCVGKTLVARHCDHTAAHAAMVTAGEQDQTGRYAYIWLGSAAKNEMAGYQFDCHFTDILADDNYAPDDYGSQVWVHGASGLQASNITARTTTTAESHLGLRIHDTFGARITTVTCKGHEIGVLWENDPSDTELRDCKIDIATGMVGMSFDTASAYGCKIRGLSLNGGVQADWFAFGPSFTDTALLAFTLEDIWPQAFGLGGGYHVGRAFIAEDPVAETTAFGMLVEMLATSPTSSRHVSIPNAGIGTNPSTRTCAILWGQAGAGYVICQELGAPHVLVINGSVAPGDLLRPADPTGAANYYCAVDNAPADFNVQRTITSKSVQAKGAGAGYVACVPA